MKFTEEQLLKLLKVQSNISLKDFNDIFGVNRGSGLFQIFARENWNIISFMFNKINGQCREEFLNFINNKLNN